MSKKGISILIVAVIGVILGIIIIDFLGDNPRNRGGNPYELNVDEYRKVDPSLIHYKETKNIPLGEKIAGGMDVFKQEIFITGQNFFQIIQDNGLQKLLVEIDGMGTCIKATEDYIIVGFEQKVQVYNPSGILYSEWIIDDELTVITSIDLKDDVLFAADAGNRKVVKYDLNGNLLGEFEGKSEADAVHGFIIPSPNFELLFNSYGELWVTNPGKHAIENYSEEGELRGFWEKSSMDIDGFTGCCNPAEIAVLSDGSFVTSEKGIVRIKVYDASGELISVVAAPEKFKIEGKAPEVKVDENDLIYALDFDKQMIRIFEKKQTE